MAVPSTGSRDTGNRICNPTPDYVKDRILSAFLRRMESDMCTISITIDGGKVTLTGHVRSWAKAAAVGRAAWSALGVTEVDNRIVAAEPPISGDPFSPAST